MEVVEPGYLRVITEVLLEWLDCLQRQDGAWSGSSEEHGGEVDVEGEEEFEVGGILPLSPATPYLYHIKKHRECK